MNHSSSSPSVGTKKKMRSTSSLSNLDDHSKMTSSSSIDLSTVDRDQLPLGVTRVYGMRMKLDASLNPAFLDMRMNYRNLLNEYQVQQGKLVSNQFALMKPRRKTNLEKPKELEYPPGVNKALYRKVARQRAKNKAHEERMSLGGAGAFGDGSRGPAAGEEDDESPTNRAPQQDPTMFKEVRDVARNPKVQSVHGGLEYPAHSGNGLPVDRIPRALEALSYLSPDPKRIEDALKTLLYRDRIDSPLALDEFAVIVHVFDVHRASQLKMQFERLDADGSGSIDENELRRMLWDTGYSVSRETLKEIMDEVDTDGSGTVELKEFEIVSKIVYERFGFSKREVRQFYALFDRYDADQSGELSADELAGALGWCGHPTTIAEAKDLIKRHLEAKIECLSRPEFLRIMRCVAEEELEEFRALFSAMDEDCSGSLDMCELSELFLKLGYTIHTSVIEEAVGDLFPHALQSGILFEDCVHVLAYIRHNEGFSKQEASELNEVFSKFCGEGRKELREFELNRALNWLGYPLSQQKKRQLWIKVDMDKSGSINEGEFLKLVRNLREQETQAAQLLLSKLSTHSGASVPEADLKAMLLKLGYAPSPTQLQEAQSQTSDSTGDGQTDLLGILGILRFLRETQVKKLRQSGGLSDQQAQKIRSKYALKIDQGKKIDAAEFERFMYEIFKTARNTPAERNRIRTIIQENLVNGSLGLQEMFWIVRTYDDARSEEAWAKEEKIVKEAGFSPAQVAQFRAQFVKADEDGSGALNDQEILSVFDSLMQLTAEQGDTLQEELERMEDDKDAIDFPTFLKLMSILVPKA
eukprot:TRINITY_DN89729_c0_g1_i1.p1 TRINITY_DN89729_c0_g1~~TRINITY_DN89729_c0_g1_i1.p1  ORF type:complete len:842 (-),score=191.21 TRINITY_DN89729_c0_g1_i1:301-2733(-)